MPAYLLGRLTIALLWIYQGLVPKLLGPHPDERVLNMAMGLSADAADQFSRAAGLGEVLMGLAVLAFWRHRWPLVLTAVAMIGLLVIVAIAAPHFLLGAFSPVASNLPTLALALICLQMHGAIRASGDRAG